MAQIQRCTDTTLGSVLRGHIWQCSGSCGARDRTNVGCMQNQCLTLVLSLLPGKDIVVCTCELNQDFLQKERKLIKETCKTISYRTKPTHFLKLLHWNKTDKNILSKPKRFKPVVPLG